MSEIEQWSRELLDVIWRAEPVEASMMGVSEYDDELPNIDPDAMEQLFSDLSKYESDCQRLLRNCDLTPSERLDVEAILSNLQERILNETYISEWRTNPFFYLSTISNGLHVLLSRDRVLSEEVMESIVRRTGAIPEFLEQARENLVVDKMPVEWLDLAVGSAEGTRSMIDDSIRRILSATKLGDARADDLCDKAICSLNVFEGFLRQARPLARGRFSCGQECFEQILRRVHMVDMDVEELMEFGLAKTSEYELMLARYAKEIDDTRHWKEIIAEFKKDHPDAGMLLDSYRREVRLAEEFVKEKNLISIPEQQEWAVMPTPGFARMTAPMGYMQTSPPFSNELSSILYITPVDLNASIEEQKQHLGDNCYAFQKSIAFHEVIPGHHLQACLAKLGTSALRKQCRSSVFIEGWGLYTELLMTEQGYLSAPDTSLIYLKNALWRAVRVVIDVGLHVSGMSLEEATQFLQEKVGMEHHMAFGEARRYTMSPTYQSSYLLGKEQIVRLRNEFAAKSGNEYNLKDFHDKLTSYGSIPVSLVRKEILDCR